ncbi:MAG TPA: alkaline phosphatase family protein [Myxococcales bacterium]|nr:alkaline phosphatase family protein [Myxococcales bacterium]
MPAVLVFVDGVGVGARDPASNPLARRETLLSQFADGSGTALPRGGVRRDLDASLGVPGRPQSATGHATILSGENAPALLGRHLLGFPNATLRELLARRSIFLELRKTGHSAALLNAYPAAYLDALTLPHRPLRGPVEPGIPEKAKRLKPAAAPFAFAAAGYPLATFDDVRDGTALTHDLTSALAHRRWPEVPLRTPEEAAEVLVAQARRFDFTMIDYYLTDDAGHAQDFAAADAALADLDRFLRRAVERLELDRTSLFVTSDHGNLEDLRSRNHTLAKVPLLVFGPAATWELPERLDGLMPLMLRAATG